jgi:hypothetical protein
MFGTHAHTHIHTHISDSGSENVVCRKVGRTAKTIKPILKLFSIFSSVIPLADFKTKITSSSLVSSDQDTRKKQQNYRSPNQPNYADTQHTEST